MNAQTKATKKNNLSSLFAAFSLLALAAACGEVPVETPVTGGTPAKIVDTCEAGAGEAPGPAAKIAFGTTPPSLASANVPVSFFTVEVQDAEGRRIRTDNQTIIALQVTGAGLTGTLSKKVQAGRAVFDDLVPSASGTAQIRAGAASLASPGAFEMDVSEAFVSQESVEFAGSLPALSWDGRHAAYHTGEIAYEGDISQAWLQDLSTSDAALASAVEGAPANGPSYLAGVSADGRYAVYTSEATDLVSGDTNGFWDVFLYDRESGKVLQLDTDCSDRQAPVGALGVSISASGRFVSFSTAGLSLEEGGEPGPLGIYVRDLATGERTLASVGVDGQPGNDVSLFPALSATGAYAAFLSAATNLVEGDSNGAWDVFASDLVSGDIERVSVASDGTQANGTSAFFISRPAISADGRFVAFASTASNLVEGDTNNQADVFVRDRQAGTTERVSVSGEGTQASGPAWYPSISGDGRFVAFASTASNLVEGDSNGRSDVFVHDRTAHGTVRVSLEARGQESSFENHFPALSGSGRALAFQQVRPSDGTNPAANYVRVVAIPESF